MRIPMFLGLKNNVLTMAFWWSYMVVLVAAPIFWFSFGCSYKWPQARAAVPPGCETSILYEKFRNPNFVGSVALIATSELASKYPAAKQYILGAFNNLLVALYDDQITYAELAQTAAQNLKWVNSYFGNRLMIYSQIFNVFDLPVPIDRCDRDFIRVHINRQLLLMRSEAH